MMSLSVGYPDRFCSGYPDSKSCYPFQPYSRHAIKISLRLNVCPNNQLLLKAKCHYASFSATVCSAQYSVTNVMNHTRILPCSMHMGYPHTCIYGMASILPGLDGLPSPAAYDLKMAHAYSIS